MSDIEQVKTNKQTVQGDVITGNVYDSYTDISQDVLYERAPFLGQVVCYRDGRRFVFGSTIVDVAAGTLVGSPIALGEIDSGWTVAAIGATEVTVTHASLLDNVTKGLLAGGFLILTETSGVKTTYAIVDNTVMASDIVTIYLANPLVGALAAADAGVIVAPKHANVILNESDTTVPLGVALVSTLAATTSGVTTVYQWFQTHGVGGILCVTEAGCVAGVVASISTTDGSSDLMATDGQLPAIGTYLALAAVADGDLVPIDLCIG